MIRIMITIRRKKATVLNIIFGIVCLIIAVSVFFIKNPPEYFFVPIYLLFACVFWFGHKSKHWALFFLFWAIFFIIITATSGVHCNVKLSN